MTIQKSKKYTAIGKKLIETLPEFKEIKDSDVRLAFVVSDEEKRGNHKTVLADCNLFPKRLQWLRETYDFYIVVYEPNVSYMEPWQIETVIRHELHHVGIDYNGNEPSYYVAPHDYEDFADIIKEHGIDWSLPVAEGE